MTELHWVSKETKNFPPFVRLEGLLTELICCVQGFLALEGELTPVLVHLVRSDKNTTEMLDTSNDAAKILGK